MDNTQAGPVRGAQNLEAILNEGLRIALLEKTPDQSLEVLLGYLGRALEGERTYIFERNARGFDDNTYEWTAPGVRAEKENLQNVPPEVCATWYRRFRVGKHIVIRDLESIRGVDPLLYDTLKPQSIHSLVVVPLYDDGRVIGFYGVDNPPAHSLDYTSDMLQITAHFIVSSLRRRNLLRELEERYRLETRREMEDILEGARTGIWALEVEDGREPRMYADRTMRMLLGVGEDVEPEACYRHWFSHLEPDYVEMVQGCVQEMLRSGRAEVIYPYNHPELGKIYVRCGGVPQKGFDKPGYCVRGYHQDITETMAMRREQEKTLMESLVKVKQANLAKTEFLSHMSHDIRTPINGILGMLKIAEENPDDPAKQKQCCAKIRTATEHLLSLINDVLEISKLESGETTLTRERFDLRGTLDNCLTILAPRAAQLGVKLELGGVDVQHSALVGSPLHLRQILINVIGNAVKYNRPGGSVLVEVAELPGQDGAARFCFTVEDTGIGMSEEFQQHIFEPFTQEHHGARTTYGGTGLGMTITKKLVDQMGGGIELESEPDVGTRFRITLPLDLDGTGGAGAPDAPETGGPDDVSGMRVLVAEDVPLNREIMQYMLEGAGATVVTAENGKQAAELFAASQPFEFDCVLMDLMMPVMDGLEAVRAIRAMDRPDAKSVPVIAVTANAFYEDAKLSLQAGMDEHIPKPVDFDKLFQTMYRLKHGHTF